MTTIPPHYTDRYIVQRYNKALNFVQNLPASSSFQPTKSQKLELYALYKQVSQGDINTQRPGLFDVVGRAKWDAWKKLEGLSVLEARHIYVEALLRVATEAYKRNVGREEAQQIIHAFAIMRPSGDDSDDLDTDDTSNLDEEDDDEEDTSVASEDAEEQAYLRDIQESTTSNKGIPFQVPDNNTTPYGSPDRHLLSQQQQQQRRTSPVLTRGNRPPSAASINTMVTAPMTPRQMPSTSTPTTTTVGSYNNSRPPSVANSSVNGVRPRSALSTTRLGQNAYRGNEKRPNHMTRDDLRVLPNKDSFNEEEFDDSVNPWQHIPTSSSQNHKLHHQHNNIRRASSSEDSIENINNDNNRSRTPAERLRKVPSASHLRLPSPMYNTSSTTSSRQPTRLTSSLSSPSPPPYPPQLQSMTPINNNLYQQSPVLGSSASSSVTATPQLINTNSINNTNNESRMVYTPTTSRSNSRSQIRFGTQNTDPNHRTLFSDPQYTSVVALGPATKRALESLQNEVIALNDRIDDLRRELVERDKQRAIKNKSDDEHSSGSDDDIGDGWRWVIKAAIKYAGVNLMTALILFFILYKSGSPVAYAILKQSNKMWQSFKLRVLISNVVV